MRPANPNDIVALPPDAPDSALDAVRDLLGRGLGERYITREDLRALLASEGLVATIGTPNPVAVATARLLDDAAANGFRSRWPELAAETHERIGLAEASTVDPSARGRGFGTTLATFRVEWLLDAGADVVASVSWRSGRQESFQIWQRVGLTHVADRARYWNALPPGNCPRCAGACECTASLMAMRAHPRA